ncbi:hypothetical protein COCOBI_05-0980 [Coccomyxa sp. Obi]|nr:hypothetical protein COCOBI_05-0980 [Coccomyxa sp. Obi]
MTHGAFGVVSFLVFLSLWGEATSVLFNFTDALSPWLESWTNTPSAEASSNLQLLQNNQNSTATLGTILFNPVNQNQSYAVAEAVRFALLPSSDFNAADPANAPAYQALTANIGAATAYAMHYANQKAGGLPGGLASTEAPAPPPTAGGPTMRGGPDPPVAVQPSATDIFNAVAAGALGAVASSCGR